MENFLDIKISSILNFFREQTFFAGEDAARMKLNKGEENNVKSLSRFWRLDNEVVCELNIKESNDRLIRRIPCREQIR